MSILKEIKGTLQSVQQDISTSIKSLTVSTKDKELGKRGVARVKAASSRGEAVNLDAGADILHRYQESWSELHHQAEENATRAENTAISIGSLFVKINQQSRSLAQLAEEAQGLPTILQQLQDLTNQIACVEELCEQVEAAEIQLENVCEEEEFRQAQTAHHMQLALYRQKKQAAADKHRVELAQQHARNVKSRDTKRQSQLQERQSIFQEAFDNDVNYYRTFGKTERQPSVEKEAAPVDLADIKIDDEAEELDNFLGCADITPVSDRPQEFNEEMPEMDDDSGVIHDDSGSPEPVSHYPTTDQSDSSVPINNETQDNISGDEKLRDISSGKTAETETSDEASVTGSGCYDQGHDQSNEHKVSVQPDTHPQPVKNLASELETAEMLCSEAESLQPASEVPEAESSG